MVLTDTSSPESSHGSPAFSVQSLLFVVQKVVLCSYLGIGFIAGSFRRLAGVVRSLQHWEYWLEGWSGSLQGGLRVHGMSHCSCQLPLSGGKRLRVV